MPPPPPGAFSLDPAPRAAPVRATRRPTFAPVVAPRGPRFTGVVKRGGQVGRRPQPVLDGGITTGGRRVVAPRATLPAPKRAPTIAPAVIRRNQQIAAAAMKRVTLPQQLIAAAKQLPIIVPRTEALMRPGDERPFIHKKILGGISAITGAIPIIPGSSVVSRITGALAGGGARMPTARVTPVAIATRSFGQDVKFPEFAGGVAPGADCLIPFQRRDPRDGKCKFALGERVGRDDQPIGDVVMGQYGAGEVPGVMAVDRSVCRRGMQLGNDGVCYNKTQISNKQRMWPAGRKPLLTGGEMRAIGIAARAGRRMDGATKRLRKLGMMKALPASRRAPSKGKALVVKEAGPGSVTVQ